MTDLTWGRKLTLVCAAVSIVAATSYSVAENDRGYETAGSKGTHPTWADINPMQNGWYGPGPNTVMGYYHNAGAPITQQQPTAYQGVLPRIYVIRTAPQRVVAHIDRRASPRVVRVTPPTVQRVQLAQREPLNLLPPQYAGMFGDE